MDEYATEPVALGRYYTDTNTGVAGKCTGLFQRLTGGPRAELSGMDQAGRPFEWWTDQAALAPVGQAEAAARTPEDKLDKAREELREYNVGHG